MNNNAKPSSHTLEDFYNSVILNHDIPLKFCHMILSKLSSQWFYF